MLGGTRSGVPGYLLYFSRSALCFQREHGSPETIFSGLSIGMREIRTAIGSLGYATYISESVSLLHGTYLSIKTGVESREGKSAPPARLVTQFGTKYERSSPKSTY